MRENIFSIIGLLLCAAACFMLAGFVVCWAFFGWTFSLYGRWLLLPMAGGIAAFGLIILDMLNVYKD